MHGALNTGRFDFARAERAAGWLAERRGALVPETEEYGKRPEHLTERQGGRLAELVRRNLKAVRSYLLKEDLQFFWGDASPYSAGRFFDPWRTWTMHSQVDPMKCVARMLRGHGELSLNWFGSKGSLSSGMVEGFKKNAKWTTGKAFGIRSYHAAEVAPYHTLGDLPGPQFTPGFF